MSSPSSPSAIATAASNSESPKTKKEKKQPANVVIPPPKPKLSKAERRALQEQQRADKAARGGVKRPVVSESFSSDLMTTQTASAAAVNTAATNAGSTAAAPSPTNIPSKSTKATNSVSLVSHLPPYHDPNQVFRLVGPTLQLYPQVAANAGNTFSQSSSTTSTLAPPAALHPCVLQLGLDYANLNIRGGNARCRAMLHCFQVLLQDYQPQQQQLQSGTKRVDIRQALLHQVLNPAFDFWTHSCRPHSVSMGNAFTFLKHVVASLERTSEDDHGDGNTSDWFQSQRKVLLDTLEQYERERLDFAGVAIAELALPLLSKQPEVVLVFGYSEAVAVVLLRMAQEQQEKVQQPEQGGDNKTIPPPLLRVIVVDSRPDWRGKRMLETLCHAGLSCTYILVNALSYVIQDVTKVLLGASALLSDGSVLGAVGTGCVALAAYSNKIPVLVCCETYKISNKLYLESITHNELGNPSALDIEHHDQDSGEAVLGTSVKKLHLLYDLTPASFVSGIVTELGIVPATSVAVLLREMTPQEYKYED